MTIIAEEKKALIEALLSESVLARIATANARTMQPHVVPVWFLWDGKSIWVHCYIGTRKFKDLVSNPRLAVLVESKEKESKLQAVLLEGTVELIAEPRELVKETAVRIYLRYIGPEGVQEKDPQSWINDPEIQLIKLTPNKIISW